LYESHKKELNSDSKLTVSVDLQKVIMLPRMECFKAIFTKRIIVFNESFVPIGKKNKVKPLTIVSGSYSKRMNITGQERKTH